MPVSAMSIALEPVTLGATFALWAKAAISFGTAAGLAGYGTLLLIQDVREREVSLKTFLRLVALGAIFLVVLTRGAAHNNPTLFAIYDAFGPGALAVLAGALLLLGAGLAMTLCRTWDVRSIDGRLAQSWNWVLTLLAVGAAIAAAQPVLVAWDLPSWSDAASYDRYAHLIAMGQRPAGISEHMPIFQYGPAALYWAFGHFFFVQQIANVVLAPITVVLVALAAARLLSSPSAGLIAGLLAMSHDHLRYTPNMMTIENWYIPAIALTVYCAALYLDRPSRWHVAAVALAAGIAFNVRLQGAFYCAFVLLVPLFAIGLANRKRIQHIFLACLVFAATLMPWTVRNAIVEGHFSPGNATISASQMAHTGDRRVFYGIRRGEHAQTITKEWAEKYPDVAERNRAKAIYGWLRPLTDPKFVWLEAVPWRFLAFYGMVPPGVFATEGLRPTNWSREGLTYALRVAPVLMLLLASFIGFFFVRPWRYGLFLLGGIAGHLAIIVWAGFSEPRVSYPAFLLHMILAAAPFAVKYPRGSAARAAAFSPRRAVLIGAVAVIAVIVGAVASRAMWGERYALRPLTENLTIEPGLKIDLSTPDISCTIREGGVSPDMKTPGRPVRIRAVVSNYHSPVKYYGLANDNVGTALKGFPPFTTDPKREIYFAATPYEAACVDGEGAARRVSLSLAFAGASADTPLREGDELEVEGTLMAWKERLRGDRVARKIWIHAKKARLLKRSGRIDY